jgi:hypothetical protein
MRSAPRENAGYLAFGGLVVATPTGHDIPVPLMPQ